MAKLIYVKCPKCKARAYVHNYKQNSRIRNPKKLRSGRRGSEYGRCRCGAYYIRV